MVKRKSFPQKDAGAVRISASQTSGQQRRSTAVIENKNTERRVIKKKIYTAALKEIKYLQRTTHLLIPRAPFLRLVIYILFEIFVT